MSKKSVYPPGFEVFDELPPPDPEHLALVVAVPLRVVVLACGCQLVDDGGRVLVPAWIGATAEELREIADAVNGRAALSAVLRDMAKDCEAAWEGTPLRRALVKYVARLREIAGEGETPTGKGVG